MLKGRAGIFMAETRAKIVLPYIRGDLLDIACGTNSLVRMYGGNSIGADVRQWGDVDVILKPDGSLSFPSESFDTVTILAALSHIKYRGKMLCEVNRVLRPKGLLVVTSLSPIVGRIVHLLAKPLDMEQAIEGFDKNELTGISNSDVRLILKSTNFRIVLEKRILVVSKLTVAEKENKCLT